MSTNSAAPEFLEAVPINGYLPHAIRMPAANALHRTAPHILVTYARALCGVGRGGMLVRLDEEAEPRAWKGIDGCNRCHVAVSKLRRTT